MIKKIFLLICSSLLILQCGFTPIHLNKSNFSIKQVEFIGDKKINNFIKVNLARYKKTEQEKKFDLVIDTKFSKNIYLKDKSAKVTEYKLLATSNIKIFQNGIYLKEITLKEEKNMNSMNDKFEEEKYERSIKQNFASSIENKLILELSLINDN